MIPPSFLVEHRRTVRLVLITAGVLLILLSGWSVWATYQSVIAPQSHEIRIELPVPASTAPRR